MSKNVFTNVFMIDINYKNNKIISPLDLLNTRGKRKLKIIFPNRPMYIYVQWRN